MVYFFALSKMDYLGIPRTLCVNNADPGLVEVKLLSGSPATNKQSAWSASS